MTPSRSVHIGIACALVISSCSPASPRPTVPRPRIAVVDPCEDGRKQLKRARESLAKGKIDRARRILDLEMCDALDAQRDGLRAEAAAQLGDLGVLNPFDAFVEARKARDPIDARRHWDRGALALEKQSHSRGRLVALTAVAQPAGRLSRVATSPPSHKDTDLLLWPDELDGRWVPRRISMGLLAPWVDLPIVTHTVPYKDTTHLVRPGAVEDVDISPAHVYETNILPGGRWVLACKDRARLVDPTTGAVVAKGDGECGRLEMVGIDRFVTTFPLKVWELPTMRTVATPPVNTHTEDLFFDRAMKRMAYVDGDRMADDAVVTVIDLGSGDVVWSKSLPQGAPFLIDLSDDGGQLAIVGEKTRVVDLARKRLRQYGGAAHYEYRPGHYHRNGWGDLHSPPIGTDAVAAFDDGRVCVVQGDTPALLPKVRNHHCDIRAGGVVEAKVKPEAGYAWRLPHSHGEYGRRTLRIDPKTKLVARIEVKKKVESIALYDTATGAFRLRIPVSTIKAAAKGRLDHGFWIERIVGSVLVVAVGWAEEFVEVGLSTIDGSVVEQPTPRAYSALPSVVVSPALKKQAALTKVTIDALPPTVDAGSWLSFHTGSLLRQKRGKHAVLFDLKRLRKIEQLPADGIVAFNGAAAAVVARPNASTKTTAIEVTGAQGTKRTFSVPIQVQRVLYQSSTVLMSGRDWDNFGVPQPINFVFDVAAKPKQISRYDAGLELPPHWALSPSGKLVALASYTSHGKLVVRDAASWEKVASFKGGCDALDFVTNDTLRCGKRLVHLDGARGNAPIAIAIDAQTVTLHVDGSEKKVELESMPAEVLERRFRNRYHRSRLVVGDLLFALDDAVLDVFRVTSSPQRASYVASVTPIGAGFAVHYPEGFVGLIDVELGPGWYCQYRDILTPFQACAERLLVEGHYRGALTGSTTYREP